MGFARTKKESERVAAVDACRILHVSVSKSITGHHIDIEKVCRLWSLEYSRHVIADMALWNCYLISFYISFLETNPTAARIKDFFWVSAKMAEVVLDGETIRRTLSSLV